MTRAVVNADFTGDNLSEYLGQNYSEDKWNEIIETMLHKSLFDDIKRDANTERDMKLLMIAILEMSLGKDDDKEIPPFLNKIGSVLIYHKNPNDWDAREFMCAYMNTICAWSEVYGDDKDIYHDHKGYVITELYSGLKDFVLKKMKASRRKLISFEKFKWYMKTNGLIKNHGSTHGGKIVNRDIVYNLRQRKTYK